MVSSKEISEMLKNKREGKIPEKNNKFYEDIKMKKCPECQLENKENAKFCIGCGMPFEEKETPDTDLIEDNFSSDELDDKNINLIIQELNLDNEGLKFKRTLEIKGWSKDLDQLEYENIENIEFNNDILTINTVDTNIEINGLAQDSGEYIVSYVQEMIARIKPQIDAESMDKIQKAKDLFEAGAIDEEEFENIKRKILEKVN